MSFVQGEEITLSWAPVEGASHYQLVVYQQSNRYYEAIVNTNLAYVSLGPGDYSWFVFPITNGQIANIATVQSTLTVK